LVNALVFNGKAVVKRRGFRPKIFDEAVKADLNPFGFHNWPVDRRLSSMMSPTMILEEGKPRFVLGSGGSNRIRTAILQVISNLIDFRQSLPDAIAASRLHWENQQLGSAEKVFRWGLGVGGWGMGYGGWVLPIFRWSTT
jgi:hypothetical protein